MSDNVARFLAELGRNPKQIESFERDPDGTMDAAGLSADEKQQVLAKLAADGPTRVHVPDDDDGEIGRVMAPDDGDGDGSGDGA